MQAGYFHSTTLQVLSSKCGLGRNKKLKKESGAVVVMNRGTWARVHMKQKIVETFVNTCTNNAQIICLGAGYEWLGLELVSTNRPSAITWVDIDLATVVEKKRQAIGDGKQFGLHLTETRQHGARFQGKGGEYVVICGDLREDWRGVLQPWGITNASSTLILIEIVTVYLERRLGERILRECREWVCSGGIMVLEHIERGDSFGKEMRKNLSNGGLRLCGMLHDVGEWRARMEQSGWTTHECGNMWEMWGRCVGRIGQSGGRVEGVNEMLDEVEEIRLLMTHYAFILAGCTQDWLTSIRTKVFPYTHT